MCDRVKILIGAGNSLTPIEWKFWSLKDVQVSRRSFVETATLAVGALDTAQLVRASAPLADVKTGLYSITSGGV
jgi:hypothetical protein